MGKTVARNLSEVATASFGLATGDAVLVSDFPIRFSSKIRLHNGCWFWTSEINSHGYAMYYLSSGTHKMKRIRAHKWAYEHLYGTVDVGLVLDHLCGTKHCVNPQHLEPVTSRVNTIRHYRDSHSVQLYICPNCKAEHYLKERPDFL